MFQLFFNVAGMVVAVIGTAIVLCVVFFVYMNARDKENHRRWEEERAEKVREIEEEMKTSFEKDLEKNDLSKAQIDVLIGIDSVIKDYRIGLSFENDLIKGIEGYLPKFDSGKIDSPLLRKRLEWVHESLMGKDNRKVHPHTAASFALKYNL